MRFKPLLRLLCYPPPSPPKTYGVLLFRAYALLDVFGPLQALHFLSSKAQLNLYLISETLHPVTTEPQMPSINTQNSSFYPTLNPTHTLSTAPDIDVLIIPGGPGARSPNINATVEYIAATYPKVQYLITICTGSFLAARSGVLDGRKATSNKAAWNQTRTYGPDVDWVPRARWVVDGNIWSSSGISAGIDATLAFIGEIYGEGNATEIANMMEYERHTDPDWDPWADVWGVPES
ncbi:hypothetical protein BDV12DRAFT_183843 [Aspergillus spectabilis]